MGLGAFAHRVLVAEDDPDISELLSMIVESCGGVAIHARNGEEAVARASEGVVLALVDLSLPLLGGGALLRALAVACKEAPIVIVSAARDAADLAAAGLASALIEKPFDVDLVSSIVRGYLSRNES